MTRYRAAERKQRRKENLIMVGMGISYLLFVWGWMYVVNHLHGWGE